jgi:hypothetical protein
MQSFSIYFPLINSQGLVVEKALETDMPKLERIEKVFSYRVQPESAYLSSYIKLNRNSDISSSR